MENISICFLIVGCFFFFPLLFKCSQIFMDLNSASTIVLQVLTQATSQDTAVLKPAEEQLKQWETQPGFYSVLLVRYSGKVLFSKLLSNFECGFL